MKKLRINLLLTVFVCIAAVFLGGFKSVEAAIFPSFEFFKQLRQKPVEIEVSISVVNGDDAILPETDIKVTEGQTVFDALKAAAKQNEIVIDYKGKGKTAYIKGIADLYEFDGGPESGWVYSVNGTAGKVSCGAEKLKNGDKIEWFYVKSLKEAKK